MLPFQVQSCAIFVGRDVFGVSPMIERELFGITPMSNLRSNRTLNPNLPKHHASGQKNRLICGYRADNERGGRKQIATHYTKECNAHHGPTIRKARELNRTV